jgi:hypothetical protein
MSKKIGDVIIALLLLVFIISGFSIFINSADTATGTSSYTNTALGGLNGTLKSDTDSLQGEFIDKTGNTSVLASADSSGEDDKSGRDAAGLLNILSKNVLVGFLSNVALILNVPPLIFWFRSWDTKYSYIHVLSRSIKQKNF